MSATQGLFKSSFFSIIARFIGVALNFGVIFLLTNQLDVQRPDGTTDTTDSGVILLLMTLINGVALISRIGVEQYLIKEISGVDDKHHSSHSSRILFASYKVVLAFSLIVLIIWLASATLLQEYLFHQNIDILPLMLSGIGFIFFNLLILNAFFHRGIRRTISAVLLQNALPATTFLVLLAVFLSSVSVDQLYVNLYTASLILAGIVSTFIIAPDITFKNLQNTIEPPPFVAIIKKSLPLALVSLAPFIMVWADTVMVGALLSTDQVALFNVAARVSFVSLFFLGALDATIYPRLVNISKNQPESLKRFFWLTTGLVAAVLLLVTLVVAFLGPCALQAFGSAYTTAYPVLVILLFAQWLRATSLTFSFMFIIREKMKYLNIIMVCAVIINFASNATLIPRYGIEGAAIATTLANLFLAVSVALLFFKNRLLTNTVNA